MATNNKWTYDDFKASKETEEANAARKNLELSKPGDFAYADYKPSDAVTQAQQQLSSLSKPGAYQSQWQTQLNDTLNKILNREKFSYDLNGDALYQQYKDQYVTQGKQAMMDTMGQAAALTGGYGNSYAQTVGQQTYQGYLQQLNDRVPELYQLALDQYNREGDNLLNQYGLMADQENQAYSRYRDQVSDYNTERDYLTNRYYNESEMDYNRYSDAYNRAYGEYRDSVSDWQNELNRADNNYFNLYDRDYNQYSDNRNLSYDDYWNNRNMAYQQERDQVSDAQWQAQFDEAKRQFDEQFELEKKSSSGGSSGGSSSGGSYDADTAEVQKTLKAAGYDIVVDGIWGPQTQKAFDDYNSGGGGDTPQATDATNRFEATLHPEDTHDAIARQMYGSYRNYVDGEIQKALKNGTLTESEAVYLFSKYGIY